MNSEEAKLAEMIEMDSSFTIKTDDYNFDDYNNAFINLAISLNLQI